MPKNALIELLGEKPLEKITVYEICRKAQINRTTFYKYYGSPSDLLEDVEKDFFREVEERFQGASHLGVDLLCSFLELIREKKRHLPDLHHGRHRSELCHEGFQSSRSEGKI